MMTGGDNSLTNEPSKETSSAQGNAPREEESKSPDLVDELEAAIKSCFSSLLGGDVRVDQSMLDVRASAEPALNQLLESARRLEAHLIRRRQLLAHHRPEWLIREELQDLKAELRRRQDLQTHHKAKVSSWRNKLAQPPATPPVAGGMMPGYAAGHLHPPGHTSGHPVYPYPPHMMAPGGRPVLAMSTPAPPYMTSPPTHQGDGGPLARLEQTTSSIGMPAQNIMYRMH